MSRQWKTVTPKRQEFLDDMSGKLAAFMLETIQVNCSEALRVMLDEYKTYEGEIDPEVALEQNLAFIMKDFILTRGFETRFTDMVKDMTEAIARFGFIGEPLPPDMQTENDDE